MSRLRCQSRSQTIGWVLTLSFVLGCGGAANPEQSMTPATFDAANTVQISKTVAPHVSQVGHLPSDVARLLWERLVEPLGKEQPEQNLPASADEMLKTGWPARKVSDSSYEILVPYKNEMAEKWVITIFKEDDGWHLALLLNEEGQYDLSAEEDFR